ASRRTFSSAGGGGLGTVYVWISSRSQPTSASSAKAATRGSQRRDGRGMNVSPVGRRRPDGWVGERGDCTFIVTRWPGGVRGGRRPGGRAGEAGGGRRFTLFVFPPPPRGDARAMPPAFFHLTKIASPASYRPNAEEGSP